MDLKDFVRKALVDVVDGVYEARKQVQESDAGRAGAKVSPIVGTGIAVGEEDGGGYGQIVEFDVALSVVRSKQYKGEGGAKLMVFSVGAGATGQSQTTSAHRIKFTVPLVLPQTVRNPGTRIRSVSYQGKNSGIV